MRPQPGAVVVAGVRGGSSRSVPEPEVTFTVTHGVTETRRIAEDGQSHAGEGFNDSVTAGHDGPPLVSPEDVHSRTVRPRIPVTSHIHSG